MVDKLQQTAQSATSKAGETAGSAGDRWNAMSEEQKQQTFDRLPESEKKGKTYTEWIQEGLHNTYENWMPWIEDQYLKWFTKDNKASYGTKDTLGKSKVTGVQQVDQVQDGVHDLVAGQVGQGGVLQPVGDMVSKEGINRAERGGKDHSASFGGSASSVTDPVVNNAKSAGEHASSGAEGLGSSVLSGAKSAGGYLGGMLPGGRQAGTTETGQKQQSASP